MTTWNGAGVMMSGEDGMFGNFVRSYFGPGPQVVVARERVEVSGILTLQVDLSFEGSNRSFFVDEHRGFIPIEARFYGRGNRVPQTSAFVTDIQQCSGDRWFPMRCVAVWTEGEPSAGNHFVREVVVTKLDIDNPPGREQFSLNLPAGMAINDPDRAPSQYLLKEAQKATLADLPALYERTLLNKPYVAVPEPAIRGFRGWLIGLNVILIAMLLAAYFVMQRRSRTA
jgi:hypothetical protein